MRAPLVAMLALLMGCALTSKSKPVDVRYFALDPDASPAVRAGPPSPSPQLGLGSITSSIFLRNRIVFRRSNHEVGTYDDERWTEYPETYLRRSLSRALFDTGAFVEGLGDRVPTVDVELVAFEEVIQRSARAGRVQIAYRLHDDRTVLATGIIAVEKNAGGDGGIAFVVSAIGVALNEATERLSNVIHAYFASVPGAP
jgi:ABC-type uncharacterized transport system auxiliary subunit